ncbi:LOW QUALITY PROTEIN: N-acetyllactosaminide beta-1,3-N-acetylglucosaminyltransferase 4-like [Ruditapes philippinarum]|uniref:LOW QUALITY PROTEIN: N-acetyllactosaminide beta-1,3-N-acetylglucosaminyltransferase 4-like n=1 Tax=Ruditapes philippinarum TaxID=129788 RepID=UPI00295B376A|nr:LOW QUALITY PROTEIN: N-acetyllactosaminide beta-1,3-N-acetylglucosaminyltransferase 4-like [Ruditapes philippinarum]
MNSNNVPHARFVLKADDDMYINIPNLLAYLNSSAQDLQNKITGSCSKSARPIRNSKSKWYASERSYKEKQYPGFSGTAYATSMNVVKKIYNISCTVTIFSPIEDIYVSLCLRLIGGSVLHKPGFHIERPKLDACLYKGNKLFTAHSMTPDMIRNIWKAECKK